MQLRHSAPKVRRTFDQHDVAPRLRRLDGCRKARDSPADDENASAGAFGLGMRCLYVHAPAVFVRYLTGRLIIDHCPVV